MQTVTYSDARQNLKAVMDKAVADCAPILVTPQRGEDVVMISASERAAWRRRCTSSLRPLIPGI